jgi:integrase
MLEFVLFILRQRRGVCAATIAVYVSAVRAYIARAGERQRVLGRTDLADDTHGCVSVDPAGDTESRLLRRLRQDQGVSLRRDAVDLEVVRCAWEMVSVDIGVRTAVVLLWFTSLRPSELLAKQVGEFDGVFSVTRDCLTWDRATATLKLYMNRGKSGEGRVGVGETRLLVALAPAAVAAGHMCPVACVLQYLEETRAAFGGDLGKPLLRRLRDGGNVTADAVSRLLKACVRFLGLDDALVSAYSLRCGGVSALLAAGASHDVILQQYGASATSVMKYHRRTVASERLAQGLLGATVTGAVPGPRATPHGRVDPVRQDRLASARGLGVSVGGASLALTGRLAAEVVPVGGGGGGRGLASGAGREVGSGSDLTRGRDLNIDMGQSKMSVWMSLQVPSRRDGASGSARPTAPARTTRTGVSSVAEVRLAEVF